jgi:Domain of unknown function (DUF4251)
MSTLKTIFMGAWLCLALQANAQTDKATTAKIVEAKSYTFVATSATPMNAQDISRVMSKMPGAMQGGTINLNETYYQLKVTADSIVSFLPYYGRAFNAPMNQTEGGVKFNSKKFEYKTTKGKKRGWNITVNTQDTNEGYRFSLSISESGYATLSLNSNNKQSITYNGYLMENKDETK